MRRPLSVSIGGASQVRVRVVLVAMVDSTVILVGGAEGTVCECTCMHVCIHGVCIHMY